MIPQTPNHHRLKISEHHHFDSKHFRLSGQIPKSHIWSESGHVWVKCYIPCVFVGFQSHVTLMSDLIRWDISVDATLKIQNKYIKRSMSDMLQMLQTYRYAGHGMICFPEPSNNHNKARCPISRDVLIISLNPPYTDFTANKNTKFSKTIFWEETFWLCGGIQDQCGEKSK